MHRIDRSARGIGRHSGPQSRKRGAEPHFLALHVAARLQGARCSLDTEGCDIGIAMRLGPVSGRHSSEEQQPHRGEDCPALALVFDHPAEDIGEPGTDREDRDQLDQIRYRVRVLVRMRRVGVKEPAAIGAEFLDDLLRGDRALCDGLLSALKGRRVDIGTQILRHPLPNQHQSPHHRDRYQEVERAAGQIDPEIADCLGLAPHEPADQCQRHRDAGRR